MNKVLLLVGLALVIAGCNSGGGTDANNNATSSTPQASAGGANTPTTPTATNPGTGSGGGVTPMASGAAGGMTPMSGTDSVEGAGGGSVGAAAKDLAKRKTANAGAGSMGQAGTDETGQ